MIKVIRTYGRTAQEAETLLQQVEVRSSVATSHLERRVQRMISTVRRKGDAALRHYAVRFDRLALRTPLRVSEREIEAAWEQTPQDLRASLQTAASNIRRFARSQMPKSWSHAASPGITLGQRCVPLASVGCYVPGGRYPLPSTLLMTVLPAQVAGVARIAVVSPNPAPETLAAAHLAGVKEFYRIGGAQAIAALAYGTVSVPRVDKIVGPGNLYVTTAKKLVAFDCGIDMLAGPTEIVVASERGNPVWIAADMVAQAEHDPATLAILVTSNADLAASAAKEISLQAASNAIARQSLGKNGLILITHNPKETATVTNRLAAEHLTVDSEEDLVWIRHAGSIFIGTQTPQAMGDYVSGPNHVLPTGRLARVRGGLSVFDFLRIVTTQKYTASALAKLGPSAIRLAQAEGLAAHAASVQARLVPDPGKRASARRSRL